MATDEISALTEAGVFADIDRYFGESMRYLGANEAVALSAAAVSAMFRGGHTCLPLRFAGQALSDVVPTPPDSDGTRPEAPDIKLPSIQAWRTALEDSAVVTSADSGDHLPLVLDGNRLYLHRLHRAECDLAERLAELVKPPDAAVPSLVGRLGDIPREAASAALGGLCIVTGGPGTGKTTLAAKLVALLVGAGVAKANRIGLVAPTGKAARRLQAAVRNQLPDLSAAVPDLADFDAEASTIHRLLRRSSLPLDALLVDECSMVDLSLMTRLTAALPDGCRLLLLGDANQLSSVAPGSVFGDLCGVAKGASSLSNCIVTLTKSHRFDPTKGIGRLADAVVQGEPDRALETLRAEQETALGPLADAAAFDSYASECSREWAAHIEALRRLPFEELTASAAFPASRVLCAHRRGPYGANRFNRLVDRELHDKAGVAGDEVFFVGRPIIVTRNDRATTLSNGDTGVVVATPGGNKVWFPELDSSGERFLVSPYRLPPHESFYALTVHRSQGSEYDEVVFIPGDPESRVSTRELFYTAVTRAKRAVTVLGAGPAAVEQAVQRATVRETGLGDRLAKVR